ncbi:GspMb/PilO family protein [Paucibacter sp. AS339]|uniref:GspMb/PilO family protein n=1 Tax=Paucibacter hankyongi TaxID=3133434 RepID=UPI0030AC2C32
MNRLKAGVQALGLPGVLGLAGLVLAAALLLLSQHWDQRGAQLQAEADGISSRLRAQRAAGVQAAQAPVTPAQWQAALPSAALRQQRLADLLEIALRQGLVSSRTEHRLSVDAAAGLERLRVSMPVSGGYAQLRSFIEAALRHDPALSLDALKLRRVGPNAAEVEADLSWSLHGRGEAVAGARP